MLQGVAGGTNGIGGVNHTNGFHTFPRSNLQRAAALEIHFKFGQLGNAPSQFGSPHGFCIGEDDAIVVADTNNHRIQVNLNKKKNIVFLSTKMKLIKINKKKKEVNNSISNV